MVLSMCEEDVKFWVNSFVWTYNPRLREPHLPFVTYPFQDSFLDKVVECVSEGKDLFVDKSRDMGVTWMVLAAFVWGWLFHGWELRVGSRTRDYVDKGGDMNSLFEKMRYILDRLPEWMLPDGFDVKRGTQNNSLCKLVNPNAGNALVGEATSPNFGRGGRSKAILYDEFQVWMCADEAWRGGADTTNCRIVVGTPAGKGNKFSDLRHDETLDIERMSLHWSQHPLKTEEWYRTECLRRSPEEIAQELDISYDASASGKVYEEFARVPIGSSPEYDYNPALPLYCGMDFGNGGENSTALVWAQVDPKDLSIRVIDSYSKNYQDINYFGTILTGEKDSKFKYDSEALAVMDRHRKWRPAIYVGDPYSGRQTTFVGQTTIQKELRKHGIEVNLNRGSNSVMERIRITSIWLGRMRVNVRAKGFIEAMQNSRWPRKDRMVQSVNPARKPVHDRYSDQRTAIEYLCEYLDGYRVKASRTENRFYKTTGLTSGYQDVYAGIMRLR